MAKITLFELKEKMATMQAAIAADAEWISEKAADPNTPMEEINAKKAHRDELTVRYDLLKKEHDDMEDAQRVNLAVKNGSGGGLTEKDVRLKAKASLYRTALMGGDVKKAYEGLGAIPVSTADLGYGENLLPTNMSRELLLEVAETNPLRDIAHVTNITGLEEPKLGFTIEDADLGDVTDEETAKEIEMTGGTVTYGRMKAKVNATVKDTVLHGKITQRFCDAAISHDVQFWCAEEFNQGDIVRLRLPDGRVVGTKVSSVQLNLGDSRYRYKCGNLRTTLVEQLQSVMQ